MTTLGDYLAHASGTFVSPNHPVPETGREVLDRLGDGAVTIQGHTDYDVNLLEMEIDAVEQPSGDRWLYPRQRGLTAEDEPYLIHHPDQQRGRLHNLDEEPITEE